MYLSAGCASSRPSLPTLSLLTTDFTPSVPFATATARVRSAADGTVPLQRDDVRRVDIDLQTRRSTCQRGTSFDFRGQRRVRCRLAGIGILRRVRPLPARCRSWRRPCLSPDPPSRQPYPRRHRLARPPCRPPVPAVATAASSTPPRETSTPQRRRVLSTTSRTPSVPRASSTRVFCHRVVDFAGQRHDPVFRIDVDAVGLTVSSAASCSSLPS